MQIRFISVENIGGQHILLICEDEEKNRFKYIINLGEMAYAEQPRDFQGDGPQVAVHFLNNTLFLHGCDIVEFEQVIRKAYK